MLVRCEPCEKDIEEGWNLAQHLNDKAHLKKLARWEAQNQVPAERHVPAAAAPRVTVDWDEDDFEPPAPMKKRADGPTREEAAAMAAKLAARFAPVTRPPQTLLLPPAATPQTPTTQHAPVHLSL